MTFQSAPQCAEAVLHFARTSGAMYNVLNFWHPGGYVQADLDDLASLIDTHIGADYMPIIDSNTNYIETIVRGLQSSIDLTATANANAGACGEGSGGGLPPNVTLCITARTGFTGRSARGRFYAIPPTAGKLATANSFTSAYGNDLADFLNNIRLAVGALSWHMVVLSRYTSNALRPTAIHNDITLWAYRNLLTDSARRRLGSH